MISALPEQDPEQGFCFYLGAVDGGCAQFYALKQSESWFVVQGWDMKRQCSSVRASESVGSFWKVNNGHTDVLVSFTACACRRGSPDCV